jgi:hypothetical protein
LQRTIAALEKILIKYSWPDAQSAAEAKRVAGIEDSSSA